MSLIDVMDDFGDKMAQVMCTLRRGMLLDSIDQVQHCMSHWQEKEKRSIKLVVMVVIVVVVMEKVAGKMIMVAVGDDEAPGAVSEDEE